jgi:ADP-ribosylglycohydrolase
MNLNADEFRDKVLACWLGKNIGGTLGAPMEWQRQVNNVTFYTQDLEGEPAPNDDLDVQLLWLIALEEKGIEITAQTLAEYWTLYLTPHWSEYGTAKINMRSGLVPPFSGTLFNEYKDSCGCFLRSEIWACVTPGNPRLAARYAYQDGIIDHGNGEGTFAEVFCAALESAAFVIHDIPILIDIALSYIPSDCGVAGAVQEAVACYQSGKTWHQARDTILEKYRGQMFFGNREKISDEDFNRGFGTGQRGWDVPSNIGMILIGLLYGKGDFGASICTAVNCGEDTDCTGATLGSLFGILHGTTGIPGKWIAPIGNKIKTACLNLGELGYYGNQLPANVDELADRTIRLARRVSERFGSSLQISEASTDLAGIQVDALMAGHEVHEMYANRDAAVFKFDFFDIAVDYGHEGPLAHEMIAKTVKIRIYNRYKIQANLSLHWYTPEGWIVSPSKDGYRMSLPANLGEPLELTYAITIPQITLPLARAVFEITIAGRSTVMLVPVMLLNSN